MIKKSFSLIILLMVAIKGFGSDAEKSLLWKITGAELEKPSYLFGTIHMICQDQVKGTEKLESVMKEVNHLYLELDFDDPEMMTKIQAGMMMENGSWMDNLKEDEKSLLQQFITDSLGMPVQMVSQVKPFFITSLIVPKMLGCQPVAFEMLLTQMAKSQQIEISGLETVQKQLDVVSSIDSGVMIQQIVDMIKSYEDEKQEMDLLQKLYADGDIAELQQLIVKYYQEYPEFSEKMLDQRNLDWMPKIQEIIHDQPAMIAVGAGHLGGEKGVVNLLIEKGYTLIPVEL